MHESCYAWGVELIGRHRLNGRRTLEVGSLNVNGSFRSLLPDSPYVGIDLEPGTGVDKVLDAHELCQHFPEASFDLVICTEMIEHDPAFWTTLREVSYVLGEGGSLVLTTRGNGFPEHRYPTDLWRFMPDSIYVLADLAGCAIREWALDAAESPGLLVLADRTSSYRHHG